MGTILRGLVLVVLLAMPALAQKQGGVLRVYHRDSPASMSIHEEGTVGVLMPMMGLFNNLVLFDQSVAQNSTQSIVPDLAKSWSWSSDGRDLTFKLQEGVKWHDGKPFTSKDVVCTFDLLTGKGEQKLRTNPRQPWYGNVESVTANGDGEATIHLRHPEPSLLTMLAARRRLADVPAIAEAAREEIDERAGVTQARVSAATELGAAERSGLEAQAAKIAGGQVA